MSWAEITPVEPAWVMPAKGAANVVRRPVRGRVRGPAAPIAGTCAAHDGSLAFLAGHGDEVIAAGALRPFPDAMPTGGIWVLDVESQEVAESFYKDDPFWKAGLRKSVRVSHWAKA